MDKYFDVEIGVCRLLMQIFGFWPQGRNFAMYVRFFVSMTVIIGFCNIPQTVKLFKANNSFDEQLEIITNCNLTITLAVTKILIVWSNQKGWLLDSMATDWTTAKTKMERKIMRKNAKLTRSITLIIFGLYQSAVFSFLIVNAYYSSKESELFRQGKINASERWRPLYLPSEFAYDVQKTPYYEITWVLQFLTTLFSASSVGAIDGFFLSLVLHLCAQMKNLRGQLENRLSEATLQYKDNSKALDLSEFAERHKFLLSFAQTIEDVFNVQFLVQLLSSLFLFSLTGYQIVKIITSDVIFVLNLIFAIYYYMCFISGLFVYCLIATILGRESVKMGETAYNSHWYELSPADAKLLILIMIRTRRPFQLTAGKFVPFSLDLYCNVLKTSGGYMSMLMAMQRTRSVDD